MPYLKQPYDWETMTGCQDCGLEYGCPEWIEAVVPHDIWARISPTGDEGGILCITCMARRLAALGLEDVPVMLAAGVFALEPYQPHGAHPPPLTRRRVTTTAGGGRGYRRR